MEYIELFRTFFVIGAFTIGGGVAMVPIIEHEVVEKKKWICCEDFIEALTVAQSLPGPLAVNISVYIGLKIKGLKGALFCTLGAVLPSFLIILLISNFYSKIENLKIVESIFKGATPAVAAVILASVYSLGIKAKFKYQDIIMAIIIAVLVSFLKISPIILIILFGIGHIIYDKFILKENKED